MNDFIGQFHVFYPWENGKTQYHNCLIFNESLFKRGFSKAGKVISFVCCMVCNRYGKVVNYSYLKNRIKDKKGGQIVTNYEQLLRAVFSSFHTKKIKYCSVRTKELHKMKVKKIIINSK